jgi:hypothetical protein
MEDWGEGALVWIESLARRLRNHRGDHRDRGYRDWKAHRVLRELTKRYGKGRWRKLKGNALARLFPEGGVRQAELPWFEAHGIGRKRIKIKAYLD